MELRDTMIAAVVLAAVVLVTVTMFPAPPAQQLTVKVDRAPTSTRKMDDHEANRVAQAEVTRERIQRYIFSNCLQRQQEIARVREPPTLPTPGAVVLVIQKTLSRDTVFYYPMPNMDACLEVMWRAKTKIAGAAFCGEMKDDKFVMKAEIRASEPDICAPVVVRAWLVILMRSRSGAVSVSVPMPDVITCQNAIAQTKNEFSPIDVSCSLNVVEEFEQFPPSGRVRAGEQLMSQIFPEVFLVWTLGGGRLVLPMRSREECERLDASSFVVRHRFQDWTICRPAEREDFAPKRENFAPNQNRFPLRLQHEQDDRRLPRQWPGWPANELK
jgi:hypothetical protein